jgi:UDP-glucose 4-epimerase
MKLKNARALITGGAGLIGSHIADRLLEIEGLDVVVYDNFVRGSLENLASATASGRVQIIRGDIRDREQLATAMRGVDFVFHQAAIRINQCAEEPRTAVDVLVGGTLNVFEAAVSTGVKKVVYASSASIYGGAEAFPTDERHHPYNNRTIYGAAKLMDEGIARSFHEMYGLRSVGLRYFNVYGPRMDITGAYTEVFIRWLDCIDRGVRPQIHGDGSASMDFVYVDDIARANVLAMESDRNDDVYNVASGTETSLLGLWRALQRVTGAEALDPEFHPPRKVNPVPRRLADTSRARSELGFEARVRLEEGLGRLQDWHRAMTKREEALIS